MSNPIPGWYPDPDNGTRHRYWDGNAWTENIRYDLEFVNADEDEILDDDAYEDADPAFDAGSYEVDDSSFSSHEGGAVAVDAPAFISPDVPTFDDAPSAVEDASQAPGAAAIQEVWKKPKWLKGAAAATAGAAVGRISDTQEGREPEFPEAPPAPGFPDFGTEDPQATAVFDAGIGADAGVPGGAGVPGADETAISTPSDAASFGGHSTFPTFGTQTAQEPEPFLPEEPTFEAPAAPAIPQQTQPAWPQETSTSAWSALLRRTEPQEPALAAPEDTPPAPGLWEGDGAEEVPEEESGHSFGVSLPTSKLPKESQLRRGLAGASGLFGRAKDALGGNEDEAPPFESAEFDAGAADAVGETDLSGAHVGASDFAPARFGASGTAPGFGNTDLDGGDLGDSEDLPSTDGLSVEVQADGFDFSSVDTSGPDLSEAEVPEGELEMPKLPGSPLKAAKGLGAALGRTSLFGRQREGQAASAAGDRPGEAPAPAFGATASASDFPSQAHVPSPWDSADDPTSGEQGFASNVPGGDQAEFTASRPGRYPDDHQASPAVEATTPTAAKANPWQLALLATGATLLLVVIAIIGVLIHSATLGPRLDDARAKLNEAQQSVVDAQNELTQAEQESGGSQ